jgi:hypothetical protein
MRWFVASVTDFHSRFARQWLMNPAMTNLAKK